MSAKRRNGGAVGVIDIFAGPGGLGEGFSSFSVGDRTAQNPFEIVVSAEMDAAAHSTLTLRAFYRLLRRQECGYAAEYLPFVAALADGAVVSADEHFGRGPFARLWARAREEALRLTLGEPDDDRRLLERITSVRRRFDELVIIGGPPCQAYSLVGRARQKNVRGFRTRGDHRHFLYERYLDLLAEFSPAAFIMENVKGILSARVGSREMFSAILRDLSDPSAGLRRSARNSRSDTRYRIVPVQIDEDVEGDLFGRSSDPGAFVVRCENHGIAQARHRVILLGIREDLVDSRLAARQGLEEVKKIAASEALSGLPRLRSGLSSADDDGDGWSAVVDAERQRVAKLVRSEFREVAARLGGWKPDASLGRRATRYSGPSRGLGASLRQRGFPVVANHETRGHMKSDLGRYLFCAAFGASYGRSPSSAEFPSELAPRHANWETGVFADRFRVQLQDRPSTTVTSHLSKDGHAFIHWDETQCRSLTVREAARLQSFPDDYVFLGNRTQQYVQVGNAVPPMIAQQLARVVQNILS